MVTINTKFGFERQFVQLVLDDSGHVIAPTVFEVKPEVAGNWVRVVWRLPPGYKFAPTNPVSRPGNDFEDPGFEGPDTDLSADPNEPFAVARHRRYAWTARNPGDKIEETYSVTLSTGVVTPNLRVINKS
ncbi:MAG TPA: hypothetical protein PL196_01110 [Burkholderiaceae bacterium]|nr:hypothetical protein [Burkholderiaceae bacterium]